MYAYPKFTRSSDQHRRLLMAPTEEATRREAVVSERARSKQEVLAEATAFVRGNGGDPADEFLVLAHCKLQVGKYQGQRFRWLLENSLGYAVYLVASFSGEEERDNPLSSNKHLFLKYTSQIREIGEAVEAYKRKQVSRLEVQRTGDPGFHLVEYGDFRGRSMKEVYEDPSKKAQDLIAYLKRKTQVRPNTNMALFREYVLQRSASAPPAPAAAAPPPAAAPPASSPAPPAAAAAAEVLPPAIAAGSLPAPAVSRSSPSQAATVKALLARGTKLSASQLAQKLMSPAKPSAVPRLPPPSESTARRRLFSADTAAGDFFVEDDDWDMVTAASQAEE